MKLWHACDHVIKSGNARYTHARLAEPRLLTGLVYTSAYSANQSDFRKRVTSRTAYVYRGEVYTLSHGSSLLYCTPTIHVYVYSQQRIHTYSFMGSRIRDSAAAVHEAAATLGFTLKKEQEKVIVAFTQGHDVFVALPTGFGNSLCCCCLPYILDKLRGFTNASFAVVVSPGGEW